MTHGSSIRGLYVLLFLHEWPPLVPRKQKCLAIIISINEKRKQIFQQQIIFIGLVENSSISPTPQVSSAKDLLNTHIKVTALPQNRKVKQMVLMWMMHSKDLKLEILSLNTAYTSVPIFQDAKYFADSILYLAKLLPYHHLNSYCFHLSCLCSSCRLPHADDAAAFIPNNFFNHGVPASSISSEFRAQLLTLCQQEAVNQLQYLNLSLPNFLQESQLLPAFLQSAVRKLECQRQLKPGS